MERTEQIYGLPGICSIDDLSKIFSLEIHIAKNGANWYDACHNQMVIEVNNQNQNLNNRIFLNCEETNGLLESLGVEAPFQLDERPIIAYYVGKRLIGFKVKQYPEAEVEKRNFD